MGYSEPMPVEPSGTSALGSVVCCHRRATGAPLNYDHRAAFHCDHPHCCGPQPGASARPDTRPPSSLSVKGNCWALSGLRLSKTLYNGYASVIHKAQCLKTGQPVILKQYHKARLTPLTHHQVTREVEIHSRVRHSSIVSLFGTFEDDDHIYMVLEYATQGDVFTHIGKLPKFQMHESVLVSSVLKPLLEGLVYLHSQGIVHRDIKPENLLLTGDMALKLADFGLSIDMNNERPVTRAGTLDYMPPEVLVCPGKRLPQDNKDNLKLKGDTAIDVWAVGVLTFELLAGKAPFDGTSTDQTSQKILRGEPRRPEVLSDQSWDFIQSCLRKASADRPSCQSLLLHPFITRRGTWVAEADRTDLRCRQAQSPLGSPLRASVRPTPLDLSQCHGIFAQEALQQPEPNCQTPQATPPRTPEEQGRHRIKASPLRHSPSRSPRRSPGPTSPNQTSKLLGPRQAASMRPGKSRVLRALSDGVTLNIQPELQLGELMPLTRSLSLGSSKKGTRMGGQSTLPHLGEGEQMCGSGMHGWRPLASISSADEGHVGPGPSLWRGDALALDRTSHIPCPSSSSAHSPGKSLPPL